MPSENCKVRPRTQGRGIPDAWSEGVKKFPFLPKLDPLGVKTGLELAAGGIVAMLLMRWFGM